jgi:hypothetical protein
MGFFGAPLAEFHENSTFAVPKGKNRPYTPKIDALRPNPRHRGVVERFIAPVLKTGDVKASGGSNPSSSAEYQSKRIKTSNS